MVRVKKSSSGIQIRSRVKPVKMSWRIAVGFQAINRWAPAIEATWYDDYNNEKTGSIEFD